MTSIQDDIDLAVLFTAYLPVPDLWVKLRLEEGIHLLVENSLSTWLPIILVLVVLALVIVFLVRRRAQTARRCLHCGSNNLKELSRETLDSRTVELPSGYSGGGDIRLQLDVEATYHCQRCRKESTFKFTEMQ